MLCNTCGQENVSGAKFCAFCGEKLAAKARTVEPPAVDVSGQDAREDVRPLKENPVRPRSIDGMSNNEATRPPAKAASPESDSERPRQMPVRTPVPPPVRREDTDAPYRRPAETQRDDEGERIPPPRTKPRPIPKASAQRPVQRKQAPKKVFRFEDEAEFEDQEFYDDEDEADDRAARVKVIAVTSAVAIVLILLLIAAFSPFGRRIRAEMNLFATGNDFLALAEYHAGRGDFPAAEAAYERAFAAAQTDFDFALKVGIGLESIGSYTSAERLFLYLTTLNPKRNEPYERLLTLFANQGKTDQYNALVAYREEKQNPGGAPTQPAQTPAAAQPTPITNTPAGSALMPPVPSHQPGVYQTALELSFTAVEGATIHYTLNDTLPTANSNRYMGTIVLESGTFTIRVVAVRDGVTSEEWSGTFTVEQNTVG